ncbi:hypothetical protein [Kribbella aluminosa]|nr:hypothetical protein [Kribbella aluminosa]
MFVLQVAGEKHLTVHEPVYVDPLSNQPWTDQTRAVQTSSHQRVPSN